MLTAMTQAAIALLGDIANGGSFDRTSHWSISSGDVSHLLSKLEAGGLICLKSSESDPHLPSSYKLKLPYHKISLLNVLEATGEHLNCNQPTKEELYVRYRGAANRLGVINQMTRIYLSEIKMSDF